MLTEVSKNFCFGGWQKVFSHNSSELGCVMKFAVYLPPQCERGPRPALFYLSGLTCTEQNFITKAGAQQFAAKHGIVVVAPDTSPRGVGVPGEDDSYDLGTGAGFYVDATNPPWAGNYRMHSYVTKELLELVKANFPVKPDAIGVTGHSMGGHGALICALRNPGLFRSVSAFAPICNPTASAWGRKALTAYFGDEAESRELWEAHDASKLAGRYAGPPIEALIDQGEADEFLDNGQLLPLSLPTSENFKPLVRLQKHYDHSYYFIASFIGEHFEHHAKLLGAD